MVRVNLIKPEKLADQHLIAEYNEILMLIAYIKKYPEIKEIPEKYCLGKGHMKFFKNKAVYLKKRHDAIKKEMRKRGFKTRKTISLKEFNASQLQDWLPKEKDLEIIRKRLIERIEKKPRYYTYYRKHREKKFLTELIKK